MEEFSVELHPRVGKGSAANRRFRRDGFIPSVVYSHGEETISVLLSSKEFLQRAERASSSQVFILKSKDHKGFNDRPAIIKELQINHFKGRVLHVDFQALKDNEEITIRVPLQFTGESIGVKDQAGILSVASHELSIRCLPRAIPRVLTIDISALKIGDSIHANELLLPSGVKLSGNPGETIVSVVVPKAVVEEVVAAAPVEGAVAAADGAPAAEGAAPADGAAAEAAPAKEGKDAKGGAKGKK